MDVYSLSFKFRIMALKDALAESPDVAAMVNSMYDFAQDAGRSFALPPTKVFEMIVAELISGVVDKLYEDEKGKNERIL